LSQTVVLGAAEGRWPRIDIEDDQGCVVETHQLQAGTQINAQDGQRILRGDTIATRDLEPSAHCRVRSSIDRLTELFEAREPKVPATLAEIAGRVELHGKRRKGKMTIRVVSDAGFEHDHHVPRGKALLVHTGDRVDAGDPLTEGPMIPADILRIKGEDALYVYMLDEVQNVYRAQGVPISDKHIEVILRQMLSKVRVSSPGDSDLIPNDVKDKFTFRQVNDNLARKMRIDDAGGTSLPVGALVNEDQVRKANELAEADGKAPCKTTKPKPATAKTLLLGITKASLQAESFLSGASFQETTKVLTDAALKGAVDRLRGLKENVLFGHLIPAGTGFKAYSKAKVKKLADHAIEEALSSAAIDKPGDVDPGACLADPESPDIFQ
jgi:DNA-directed RNA polymerase subunit beta'